MRTIRTAAVWLLLSLFLILTAGAAEKGHSDKAGGAPRPLIAIIIDDLGNQRGQGERAIALPGPVACSIMPGTAYGPYLAEQANAAGKEVMLHLPMQSMKGIQNTEPDLSARDAVVKDRERSALLTEQHGITLDTDREQLSKILAADLAFVPHTVGVNNHMGSLITRHPGHMQWLMQELAAQGDLFFVDSYTTDASVAYDIALENGVPAARRDVFLDNEKSAENVAREFERLKRKSRERGYAIAIGHPNDATLAFLEQALPELIAEGFELVPVSRIVTSSTPILSVISASENVAMRAAPVNEADGS